MPSKIPFDYTILRVVPRVDRQEFFNAGVVVYSKLGKYLAAKIYLDATKLRAFTPHISTESTLCALEKIRTICEGKADANYFSTMTQSERFNWIVAPHSALIQASPVHSGVCADLPQTLDVLFRQFVTHDD